MLALKQRGATPQGHREHRRRAGRARLPARADRVGEHRPSRRPSIKGCTEQLPNARITFDKFHVVWHANAAVDRMRRIEQRTDRVAQRHALVAAEGSFAPSP